MSLYDIACLSVSIAAHSKLTSRRRASKGQHRLHILLIAFDCSAYKGRTSHNSYLQQLGITTWGTIIGKWSTVSEGGFSMMTDRRRVAQRWTANGGRGCSADHASADQTSLQWKEGRGNGRNKAAAGAEVTTTTTTTQSTHFDSWINTYTDTQSNLIRSERHPSRPLDQCVCVCACVCRCW